MPRHMSVSNSLSIWKLRRTSAMPVGPLLNASFNTSLKGRSTSFKQHTNPGIWQNAANMSLTARSGKLKASSLIRSWSDWRTAHVFFSLPSKTCCPSIQRSRLVKSLGTDLMTKCWSFSSTIFWLTGPESFPYLSSLCSMASTFYITASPTTWVNFWQFGKHQKSELV